MKKVLTILAALFFVFVTFSCNSESESESQSPAEKDSIEKNPEETDDNTSTENPEFDTRTQGLDFIFGTDQLGTTTITITRQEWNQLLEYYDMYDKNEESVHADYVFKKGDKTWKFDDVGFRIRGNTSRVRPQIKDSLTYTQAHFKVDFEEWPVIVDGIETDAERKMAGCMKGVILKRCKDDGTYIREVFAYNYFRECGVWTSPRAGYTRLLLNIKDSEGSEDSVEKIDFGIYEMIENPDKQFLKERTIKEGGGEFAKNSGNLWKCTWKSGNGASLSTNYADWDFGVEKVTLNPETTREYSYDLKTNKTELDSAAAAFKTWINELSALPDDNPEQISAWYQKNVVVDQLIRAYAVNVILGMWDDYWINKNNYYLYFDTDKKAYFIPYDYDNILGTNGCNTDAARKNPLYWGSLDDNSRPFIQKLLKVPSYLELYKKYLLEFSDSKSGFDYSNAAKTISNYQNMIEPYIAADKYSQCKLEFKDTTSSFEDKPASWGDPYYEYKLMQDCDNNYFKIRQRVIAESLMNN